MKIDIYNFIINEMIKILPLKSPNNKYTHQIIFDSLIFILKSAISWNSKIIINNNIVYTNSIYKHFIILTKMNFFIKTLKKINNKFFSQTLNESTYYSVDSSFIANKNCSIKNIKRNPFKSNKFGFKISVITNNNNIPINIFFAGGNQHDLTILRQQLNKITLTKYLKNNTLLADKGYRSFKFKDQLNLNNTKILLPKNKEFYPENNDDKKIYKKKNLY